MLFRAAVETGFQSPYPSHTYSKIPWESFNLLTFTELSITIITLFVIA